MPFKYACFISYPHSLQGNLAERFIKDLYNALVGEIEQFTDLPVFIDPMRLKGGEFFDDSLAKTLCESVCMIPVLTPVYFNSNRPDAAREYLAMRILEDQRLKLSAFGKQENGLIIPIVLRGEKLLPQELKARRYYDFSDYLIVDEHLSSHPRYSRTIRDIAAHIQELFETFARLPDDICRNCDSFVLPSEDEARKWISNITTPKIPFPGR